MKIALIRHTILSVILGMMLYIVLKNYSPDKRLYHVFMAKSFVSECTIRNTV
jgi:hypothetical protein